MTAGCGFRDRFLHSSLPSLFPYDGEGDGFVAFAVAFPVEGTFGDTHFDIVAAGDIAVASGFELDGFLRGDVEVRCRAGA
jgi:hypothetical protein